MEDELNIVGKFASLYADKPVLRSLLQLLPGWAATNELLQHRADEIRADRTKIFFDEMAHRQTPLSEEEIQSTEFLHAFFATYRAVLSTRQQERIRLFSRLFCNYTKGDMKESADTYEDSLAILEDLTTREFHLLCLLYKFERITPLEDDPKDPIAAINRRALVFWNDLLIKAETVIGAPKDEVPGMYSRLTRTGLCRICTGMGMSDQVHLTPNFASFIKALGIDFEMRRDNDET